MRMYNLTESASHLYGKKRKSFSPNGTVQFFHKQTVYSDIPIIQKKRREKRNICKDIPSFINGSLKVFFLL